MRRTAAAAIICLALAVFHTWPIAAAPHRHSLNYNADAQLTAWIVSWIAYALPHDPGRLFAGNIFQPDDRALTYSEPLFVPALLGAPLRWLGASPVLTFNFLIVVGLALTALAGWWVVDRWTGSFGGGLVAGALLAFNAHLLTRLPHMQAVHAWAFPLAFYFADRVLSAANQDRAAAVSLAIVVAAVAVTSEYWFLFVVLMIAIQAAINLRTIRGLRLLALAGALGALVALPVLYGYLRLASEGVRRTLEDAAPFSATPIGYLKSMSRVDSLWGRRLVTNEVDVLFPGVAAILLAALGLKSALSETPFTRRRAWTLVAVAAAAFALSFGPATPIYRAAYHVLVPMQGLRVPARFGYVVLFAIAMFAGCGVAALTRRTHSRALGGTMAAAALAAVTAEAWHGPVPTTPFNGVPSIYARLDREPKPVLLVEAPFWHPDVAYMNAEDVLNAADHHAPTMNGYSGLTPDSYRRRAQWFWFFPEQWAIDAMRKEGATHVMVHLDQFGADAEMVKAGLATQHGLELVAEDPRGHRLYRFVGR